MNISMETILEIVSVLHEMHLYHTEKNPVLALELSSAIGFLHSTGDATDFDDEDVTALASYLLHFEREASRVGMHFVAKRTAGVLAALEAEVEDALSAARSVLDSLQ